MRIIIAACILLSALSLSAQEQSRLSTDIIDTYTAMIAAKPDNADLYLSRATEYASQGLLSAALTDLNDALRLAPKGDKDLRFEILSRRAGVDENMLDYDAAIADLDAAAALKPDIPSIVLARGRVLTALGRYDEAREAFNRYRRVDPRSADALFGLARLEARSGDTDRAIGFITDGINAAPNAGASYVAAAEVYDILGRRDEAISSLIRGLSADDAGAATALQRIVDMSYDGYPTVIAALDKAITDNPTAGELYYLRATIAQAHNHHRSALKDFDIISSSRPFADGVLGELMAESLFALTRYDEALSALDGVPARYHTPGWQTSRARVLSALDRNEDALYEVDMALTAEPENVEAMILKGRILGRLDRTADAGAIFAEAMMTDPSQSPELYILRASTLADPRRTLTLTEGLELPYEAADPSSLRGPILVILGRKDEAEIWSNAVSRHDIASDGVAQIATAITLAQTGKSTEAVEALSRALAAGYDNLHIVLTDDLPGASLAPLRSLPEFQALLGKE